jgi:CBS domain-containing protein
VNAKNITLLVVILHDADRLPKLLKTWRKIGVPGSTILPSAGSYVAENWVTRSGLTSFLSIFDQNKLQQRTLLSLIDDPEVLEHAIAEAERVVKGFDSPNSGILFTIPIGDVLGLQKWNQLIEDEVAEEEVEPENEETTRLMQWFEEDVKERYGKDALLMDWSKQRNTTIKEILAQLRPGPTIVRVDTPLFDVVNQLHTNPGMPAACVVNNEDRLVGVITLKALADIMMAAVMPEAYINDPDEYDKAVQFADVNQLPIAAAIMTDPVYAVENQSLEQVYQRMKDRRLSGIPVVDKLYRVKGFITLMSLMSVCFPKNRNDF